MVLSVTYLAFCDLKHILNDAVFKYGARGARKAHVVEQFCMRRCDVSVNVFVESQRERTNLAAISVSGIGNKNGRYPRGA